LDLAGIRELDRPVPVPRGTNNTPPTPASRQKQRPEAEAAYNLYRAGVSIKDMAKLWGVDSDYVPNQLVVVGRYFYGAMEAYPHAEIRNLLLKVKGGREVIASTIGAFTEQSHRSGFDSPGGG